MPVPQTDTGGWVEYTKVNGIPFVKELGKMAPQLREKGRHVRAWPQRNGPGDGLSNTPVSANTGVDVWRLIPAQRRKDEGMGESPEPKPR